MEVGVDGPPIGVDQEPAARPVRDLVKRVTVQASALQKTVAQDTPQPRGMSLQAMPPTEVVRLNYSHHPEDIRGTRSSVRPGCLEAMAWPVRKRRLRSVDLVHTEVSDTALICRGV